MAGHLDDPDQVPPTDALTSEPPVFGRSIASRLSLEGADEAFGDLATGLGPRRMKVAVFGTGIVLLVLTLATALR